MYQFQKECENHSCCSKHFKRIYNSDYIYRDMEDRRVEYNCMGKCCKSENRGTVPAATKQCFESRLDYQDRSQTPGPNAGYDRYGRPQTPSGRDRLQQDRFQQDRSQQGRPQQSRPQQSGPQQGRSTQQAPGPNYNRQSAGGQGGCQTGFGKNRREPGGGPSNQGQKGGQKNMQMFGMQQNMGPFGQCEEFLPEARERRRAEAFDCEGKQANPQLAKKPIPKESDICPRCHNPVFYAERQRGAGHSWHARCFICGDCGKQLSSSCFAERNSTDVYCFPCYNRLFGPVGYGFGVQSTLRMRDNPECENDDVVKNCTCCRNTLDPGLLCVRQHLRPTDTKEINACNCYCNEDEEDIPPPPNPKIPQMQQNFQQGPPQKKERDRNTGECSCERQMLALNIRKNALDKGSRGPEADPCTSSFRDEYFRE